MRIKYDNLDFENIEYLHWMDQCLLSEEEYLNMVILMSI